MLLKMYSAPQNKLGLSEISREAELGRWASDLGNPTLCKAHSEVRAKTGH